MAEQTPTCGATLTFWTPKADDGAGTFRECVEGEGHVTPHRSKEGYRWSAASSELASPPPVSNADMFAKSS